MEYKKISSLLVMLSLLTTTPLFAAEQGTVISSKTVTNDIIKPQITRYTNEEFLKQKGIKETIETIYREYPEAKTFTITNPMKMPFVSWKNKQRIEQYYFTASFSSKNSLVMDFKVDPLTGELRGINQYFKEPKQPLVNLTDSQLKEKAILLVPKFFGDQAKGYEVEKIARDTDNTDTQKPFHTYQIKFKKTKDENAPFIFVDLKGDVVTGIKYGY